LRQIKKLTSGARSITPCNHPISAPYDVHRRAQGGREPLRSDGKDYRADYEHDDLSPNNLKTPAAFSGERTAM
jgi:hypothetical protein